jgi:serine/threonine-protein kinase
VRTLIVDDSMLVRRGIAAVLTEFDCVVVGEAGTADEARVLLRHTDAELAIVDIRMPPTHTDEGVRLALELRRDHPALGVLVLSQYIDVAHALRLLEGYPERMGYLLKEKIFDGAVLYDAVRRLRDGECVIDPAIVSAVLGRRRSRDPVDLLTEREREVLKLVAEGRSNAGVADRLTISLRTVETHVAQIFAKLGIEQSTHDNQRVLAVLALLRVTA